MDTSANWEEFWFTMTLIIVIYYLIIIYIFYRATIINYLKKREASEFKEVILSNDFNPLAQPDDAQQEPKETAYEIHDRVEYFMEKLKELLYQEAQNNSNKEELLKVLTQSFRQFEDIKGTAFVPALHEFIIKETKKYGQIALEEDELEACWD